MNGIQSECLVWVVDLEGFRSGFTKHLRDDVI
jgi:hypothetical protein